MAMTKTASEGIIETIGMPMVTLKNTLRVGNFSSPHTFTFDDGSVLAACPVGRTNRLALETKEIETKRGLEQIDIELVWMITDSVRKALWASACCNPHVDIVLVPLPVMTATKQYLQDTEKLAQEMYTSRGDDEDESYEDLVHTANRLRKVLEVIRCVRTVDRVTKVISSTRFCK